MKTKSVANIPPYLSVKFLVLPEQIDTELWKTEQIFQFLTRGYYHIADHFFFVVFLFSWKIRWVNEIRLHLKLTHCVISSSFRLVYILNCTFYSRFFRKPFVVDQSCVFQTLFDHGSHFILRHWCSYVFHQNLNWSKKLGNGRSERPHWNCTHPFQ